MQLNPAEISELLKKRIEGFSAFPLIFALTGYGGFVYGISAEIHGLSDVTQGEMLEFPGEVCGWPLP